MADQESYPQSQDQPFEGRDVLRYFLEQQADNPNFMRKVVKRLWNGLSGLEKDEMSTAQAIFFPDDLVGRQNSLNAQLLIDYIRTETEGLRLLDQSVLSLDIEYQNPTENGTDTA